MVNGRQSGYGDDCSGIIAIELPPLERTAAFSPEGATVTELTLDHYPDHAEIVTLLKRWRNEYPDLLTLETIGTSTDGRPLLSATVTDRREGAPADKPAIYIEGNIHAGEVLPSVVSLETIQVLLSRSAESDVAELLSRYTFYIRPRVSPDGAEVYLKTPHRLRSGPIPWPSPTRQPGLHPEDVNGDGQITLMRLRDPHGEWYVSRLDPRIMVRCESDTPAEDRYQLVQEGTVEGPVGANLTAAPAWWGLDFNRSFPQNWKPEHEQFGAGPYPLSMPETRATADFFLAHPNIFAAVLYHTSGGFIFTLPSSQPLASYPHDDLTAEYRTLTEDYVRLTGCPAFPSYEEETDTARSGSLMDWSYSQMGVLTWVPELWDIQKASGARPERVAPFQALDEDAEQRMLHWNDDVLGGDGFIDWVPFDHPQLGPVEIGGWTFKFTHQNAPPAFIGDVAGPAIDWSFLVARSAPRLEIESVDVTGLGEDHWLVTVRVANVGYLPTNVCQQAIDVRRAPPVSVSLAGDGATVLDGAGRQTIGHLKGESASVDEPWRGPIASRRRADVRFVVQAVAGSEVTVTAMGSRAGRASTTVVLAGA